MNESLGEDTIIFVTTNKTPMRFVNNGVPMTLFEMLAYLGPEIAKLEAVVSAARLHKETDWAFEDTNGLRTWGNVLDALAKIENEIK